MDGAVTEIVIVGGGTAGWLAACRIAAAADPDAPIPLRVTLVESPDVATIGVGEGTWPTMRRTLERIGLDEADFLLACDACFKQGSRFVGWSTGAAGEAYLHPFSTPIFAEPRDLLVAWKAQGNGRSFAEAMTPQGAVVRQGLAPRQRDMPPYGGAVNYGYHLDAGKLAQLLRRHATERLGVRHVQGHVAAVERAQGGDIVAVRTRDGDEQGDRIEGDFFLDCSGGAALLVGDVPFIDRGDVLPNDRALAVQVPVAPDSPIAAQTDATAHRAGWIWDIGLPTRRGVGCVYASRYMSDDEAAATLAGYVGGEVSPRRLTFRSGHRERFWVGNCLAVGLSAGFLEPLEASAIVLIELSLDALLDDWPTHGTMAFQAQRFNALFRYRWDRTVDFLKLHYVLSRRDEPYWRDHRETVPDSLAGLLRVWQHRPPSRGDLPMQDEMFSAASYLYVVYGMGVDEPPASPFRAGAAPPLDEVEQRARALAASLPTNRAYLDALRAAMPMEAQS